MPKPRTKNLGYAQMFHVNCLEGYKKTWYHNSLINGRYIFEAYGGQSIPLVLSDILMLSDRELSIW